MFLRLVSGFLFLVLCLGHASAESLRIMTLNSWMIPFLRKEANVRSKIIGHEINKYDMVFLQEAFSHRLNRSINSYTDGSFEMAEVPEWSIKVNSGLVTFSSLKILEQHFLEFESCGGMQCTSKKGVQHLRVRLRSGQALDVFNTHLQAFESNHEIRSLQIKQLVEFIKKHSVPKNAALIAGDFNIMSELPEYESLTRQLAPFEDVWKLSGNPDPGYTWNPFVNPHARFDLEETFLAQRIDYIFVRPGSGMKLEIKRAKLKLNTPQTVEFGGDSVETFASDHFGVATELELVNQE